MDRMHRRRCGKAFGVLLIAMSSNLALAEQLLLNEAPITSTVQVQVFARDKDIDGSYYARTVTRIAVESIPSYFGFGEYFGEAAVATRAADYFYGPTFYEAAAIGTYRSIISGSSGTTSTRAELWANKIGAHAWSGWYPAAASIVGTLKIEGNFGEQLLKVKGSSGNSTSLYVDGVRVVGASDEGVLVNIQDRFEIVTQYERFLHPNNDYGYSSTYLGALEWGLLTWSFGELPGTTPSDPLVTVMVLGDDTQVMTCLEGLDEYFYETQPTISETFTSSARTLNAAALPVGEATFSVLGDGPGFALFRLPELDGPRALTVSVGDELFDWDGLDAFDFLAINAEGVQSFSVEGEGFGSFDDIPLFSTLFAAGGQVDFTVSVPESSAILFAFTGVTILLAIGCSLTKRRLSPSLTSLGRRL